MSDLEHAIVRNCRGLSKDVPFKYLFWVILAHFKLCFKRKRNKETLFLLMQNQMYFGLNFRRLEEKQEPKSREYDVCKRLNFPRFPGTSLNKAIGG